MEISYELYTWLKRKHLVSFYYKEMNGMIKLSIEDTARLELGYIMPAISLAYAGDLPKESDLKRTNGGASRLHNWNMLIGPLLSLNIPIDSDTKALIVSGDRPTLISVLETLMFSLDKKIKRPSKIEKAPVESGLHLDGIDEDSSLEDANTFLEFLIISFCQSFSLTPRVSAGLLVQKVEYLSKVIIKGLKGLYQPVLCWYEIIQNNITNIFELCDKDQSSVQLLFTCLRPGISSTNLQVRKKASEVIQSVQSRFKSYDSLCWDWFIAQTIMINECFEIIDSKVDNYQSFFNLLFNFSKKNLNELFIGKLSEYCKTSVEYLRYTSNLFKDISQQPYNQTFFNQGVIDYWVELAMKEAEINSNNYTNRACCVGFLCDLWSEFPSFIEIQEDIANNILGVVKRSTRTQSYLLQIMAYGRLFHLLSLFSNLKYSFAPIIYKTLTFCLIENYSDSRIREFMFVNMMLIFKEFSLIPLSILLEPLIKQSFISKDTKYQIFDFDFFIYISQHERLAIKDAILLLDLLGKILISDGLSSRLAKIPFMIISSRYVDCKPVEEFLMRYISVALKICYTERTKTADLIRARANTLDLIERIIKLDNSEMNQDIRQVFHALVSASNNPNLKKDHFQELFLTVGGPFVETELEEEESLAEESIQYESVRYDSVHVDKSVTIDEHHQKYPVWFTEPKGRAMSDIQRAKNKRLERENREKLLAEKSNLSLLLRKKTLGQQIEQRRIELGVKSRIPDKPDLLLSIIQEPTFPFQLFRIQEELREDQENISIVLKKYSRVNKYLFRKYSSFSYKMQNNASTSTDNLQELNRYLSESGFSKLVRENNIPYSMITTDEVKSLFSVFIGKLKSKSVFRKNFPELLYLLSSYMYSRTPYDLSMFSPAMHLECLYSSLLIFSDKIPRGLFIGPDPGYGDIDVVKSLNSQLEENSELILPLGYKKVLEFSLDIEYKAISVEESQAIAIEILDEIINGRLGFHFLMPSLNKVARFRAKGLREPEDIRSTLRNLSKTESATEFSKLSPEMKLMVLRLPESSKEVAVVCAQLVDDLVYSLENNSPRLISKVIKNKLLVPNKIIEARQTKIAEDALTKKMIEEKRIQRYRNLEPEVNKWREEKIHKSYMEKIEKEKERENIRKKELELKERKEKEKRQLEEKLIKFRLEKIEKDSKKRELSEGRAVVKKRHLKYKTHSSVDYSGEKSMDFNPLPNTNNILTPIRGPKVLSKLV